MTDSSVRDAEQSTDFAGLTIRFDRRVLRPRPWTVEQSRWAEALLETLPPGPVLELCSGAGQIGLAAVARSSRRLICVDADAVAAEFAAQNARAAGMSSRVEVRTAPMKEALASGDTFAMVIADPPWVTRGDTDRYPEDPLRAIDGGADGLGLARECVAAIAGHLEPSGEALLQLGSEGQLRALGPDLVSSGMRVLEWREYDGGVVARLAH